MREGRPITCFQMAGMPSEVVNSVCSVLARLAFDLALWSEGRGPRGVVLDAIQVVWHCYPGSAALPPNSPALASYMELLGPLPAAARRTTWVGRQAP